MIGTPGADDDAASRDGAAADETAEADGRTDADPSAASADGVARPDETDGGRWRHRLEAAQQLGRRIREKLAGWWRELRAFLDSMDWPEQPPPRVAVTLTERRVTRPLLVPAQGWVYGFVIQATFTWSSETTRPEVFSWYVDMLQPGAVQRLRRLAAACARDIAPHRVRKMEAALQAALDRESFPWLFPGGDQTYACEPDVTVHLDPRVRRILQPYWDQRIALECERDLDRRRAGFADDRGGPASAEATGTPPPRPRHPGPPAPSDRARDRSPAPEDPAARGGPAGT